MSYIGGGPYQAETCPACGAIMWNGCCENVDCHYHWEPKEGGDDESTHRQDGGE